MKRTATIGTISHGTLHTDDLLQAFAGELDYLGDRQLARKAYKVLWVVKDKTTKSEFLNDVLFDALDKHAPAYCYFGNTDDGADFGFWPCMESIEEAIADGEIVKCAELPESPQGYHLVVSDHGNMELYFDGKSIWGIV